MRSYKFLFSILALGLFFGTTSKYLVAADEKPAASEKTSNKTIKPQPVSLNAPATEIDALDMNGARVKLSDYRGKVVLLDFWAVWCGPCIRELPNVKEVYAKYRDKNFDILSVSLDSNRDRMQQFIIENDMPWRQIYDGKRWKADVAVLYDIHSIPRMYLIDEDGVVRYQNVRGKALHDAVEDLVTKGLDRLPKLAKSDDETVQSMAAFRMGKYGVPNAKSTLQELAKSKSKLVARRASVGMAWIDKTATSLMTSVRESAGDDDPEVRSASLTLLARAKDPQLMTIASKSLQDEKIEVRRSAIQALGTLKNAKTTLTLVKATLDVDRQTAEQALSILTLSDTADSKAAIEKLASADDHPLCVPIAVAMHQVDKKGTNDRFVKLVADSKIAVRKEAVAVLAKLDGFDPTELYITALDDEDVGVRKTAAVSLFEVKTEKAQNALRDFVAPRIEKLMPALNGRDMRKRSFATRDLANLGPAAAPVLLKEFEAMDVSARSYVAFSIGRLRNPDIVPPIADKLRDPELNSSLRYAYENILRASTDLARDAIENLAQSDQVKVRVSGIRMMATFPDEKGIKLQKEALGDPDDLVRAYAAINLSMRRDSGAFNVLQDGAKSENRQVRQLSISGLSRYDDNQTFPLLKELEESTDLSTLSSVCYAYRAYKSKEATDAIVKIYDKNPRLAFTAMNALYMQRTTLSARALGKFLDHEEERTRKFARQRLQLMRIRESVKILKEADAKKDSKE